MNFDDLLPLAGVLVGWVLNEMSGRAASKRSQRAAIGEVLTLLLMIHWRLRLVLEVPRAFANVGVNEFDGDTAIACEDPEWWKLARGSVASATERLAGHSPLISFELRLFLDSLQLLGLGKEDEPLPGGPPPVQASIEVLELMKARAEEVLEYLAPQHGFFTRRKIRRLIRAPLEVPQPAVGWVKGASDSFREWELVQRGWASYRFPRGLDRDDSRPST